MPDDMIGQTVSHYKITAKLGAGGMGEVFLATDTKLGRQVALKFLPQSLQDDPEARERLLREAQAASRLNHSNIVTVHSVERADDTDFIVMEHIEGQTLDVHMQERDRTIDDILRIANQMARALQHAHEAGIVHRDLKPGNILIDKEQRVRILDFGLAKLPGVTKLTQTGSTLGTMAYSAPEQVQGKDVDQRADLFSFGVILYEMLTGRTPFTGDHEAAVVYAITHEQPEPVERYKSAVPVGLTAIVNKALEKGPATRYQTAADIVSDLKRERRARESGVRPASASPQPSAAPKSRTGRIVIPASVVVVATVLLLVFKPWKVEIQPTQDATAAAEDRIAVMYFDNFSDPDDTKRQGEIVANLLISDLSESRYVQVVSSQRLYDILKLLGKEGTRVITPDMATQVAKKARARWMVTGRILETEPNWAIMAELIELETGDAIAAPTIEGKPGERIYSVVDRLTEGLKAELPLPVEALAEVDPKVENLTTQSPEAYQAYLEGQELDRRFRMTEAAERYKHAIAIDSTFAMAYRELANSLLVIWRDITGARKASARAVAHIDRVNDRDRLMILMQDAALNDRPDDAIKHGEELLERYPDDKQAMMDLANTYQYYSGRRNINRAIELHTRSVELDPLHAPGYNALAYAYNTVGDFERSIQAINKYIELLPNEANPYDSRGELQARSGQLEQALESYLKALEIQPDFVPSIRGAVAMHMFREEYDEAEAIIATIASDPEPERRREARSLTGYLLLHQGKIRAATNLQRECVELDREDFGDGAFLIGDLMGLGFLLDFAEDIEAARGAFGNAQEASNRIGIGGLARRFIGGARVEVESRAGNFDTVDSILMDIRSALAESEAADSSEYWTACGKSALYQGQYDTALAYLLREAGDNPSWHDRYWLGRTYLGSSRLRDAIQTYEFALDYYSESRWQYPHRSVLLHYWLGIVYEKSGRTADARKQYGRFLHLWRNADTEMAEIEDAKKRLAGLNDRQS